MIVHTAGGSSMEAWVSVGESGWNKLWFYFNDHLWAIKRRKRSQNSSSFVPSKRYLSEQENRSIFYIFCCQEGRFAVKDRVSLPRVNSSLSQQSRDWRTTCSLVGDLSGENWRKNELKRKMQIQNYIPGLLHVFVNKFLLRKYALDLRCDILMTVFVWLDISTWSVLLKTVYRVTF